ncbi:hypothetical protein NPIL_329101 [Nephila pilipes]|uniref:Uncharacterized protein n=1 Tax=Nephila pilipes TaxID=299642 RepID=A0A8X6QAP5_NEPPI|nr:hypothetical protein NPIL_329101 [Nephila pilipes]
MLLQHSGNSISLYLTHSVLDVSSLSQSSLSAVHVPVFLLDTLAPSAIWDPMPCTPTTPFILCSLPLPAARCVFVQRHAAASAHAVLDGRWWVMFGLPTTCPLAGSALRHRLPTTAAHALHTFRSRLTRHRTITVLGFLGPVDVDNCRLWFSGMKLTISSQTQPQHLQHGVCHRICCLSVVVHYTHMQHIACVPGAFSGRSVIRLVLHVVLVLCCSGRRPCLPAHIPARHCVTTVERAAHAVDLPLNTAVRCRMQCLLPYRCYRCLLSAHALPLPLLRTVSCHCLLHLPYHLLVYTTVCVTPACCSVPLRCLPVTCHTYRCCHFIVRVALLRSTAAAGWVRTLPAFVGRNGVDQTPLCAAAKMLSRHAGAAASRWTGLDRGP